MNPVDIAVIIILGVSAFTLFLQLKDRKEIQPPQEPTEPSITVDDLQGMTRSELVALAQESGVTVPKSWTKARITTTLIETLGL